METWSWPTKTKPWCLESKIGFISLPPLLCRNSHANYKIIIIRVSRREAMNSLTRVWYDSFHYKDTKISAEDMEINFNYFST